jgi:hypothetical protein
MTAEDLLMVCFRALKLSREHESKALGFLLELAKSPNPLHLELAIFVMGCCLVEEGCTSVDELSELMDAAVRNPYARHPFIWQELLKLIGKLGHNTACHPGIFRTALVVLKESLENTELTALACENLDELIKTCSNSALRGEQTQLLQQLFDYIHSNIYLSSTDIKLFTKLTKSTMTFIYFLNPNSPYFSCFLSALNKKIDSLPTFSDRCLLI